MTTTQTRDSCIVFNTAAFQEKIEALSGPFTRHFSRINRSYVLFHMIFVLGISLELLLFGLFFPAIVQSTVMAFSLAGMFLTLFSYLVLLFYMQGRRPERLQHLRDEFIEAARSCIPFDVGSLEYHCCITEAIVHVIHNLKISNVESRWILASETLTYLIEKFRIWTRWKDLLKLKEMLLFSSITEHIRLIKSSPADLEAHSSLASNYVALADLYQDPKKLTLNDDLCWTPPEYESETMRSKFEVALERALEEYHIIDAYAPLDPWVHAQRAALYKELGNYDKEQEEYEHILNLDPANTSILARLGKLYFRKGANARGLKIYDELQRLDPTKAKEIITFYDAYSVEEYTFDKE